jgi:cytochrome c-type biogenesis protein CcmH/NrfF
MLKRLQLQPRQFAASPIFWARALQTALLCVIAIVMLGAVKSPFDRIGHQLICTCGCGQILLECNHVGCTYSTQEIAELRTLLANGADESSIQKWFVAKYGATVLSAPLRGGFDNAAWIVPVAVFLLATIGTFGVVWLWKRRALRLADAANGYGCGGVLGSLPQAGPAAPHDAALRERIRRETEF